MDTPTRTNNSQLIGGLVLIAIGVLFLLDKFWIWDIGHIVSRWWPLMLIGMGVWLLAQRGRQAGMGPMVLILIGGFFLARQLDWFEWRWREFWPVLLIAMGAWMLIERSRLFARAQPSK